MYIWKEIKKHLLNFSIKLGGVAHRPCELWEFQDIQIAEAGKLFLFEEFQ